MATKRNRGSSWEFIVKRKGLLPRPLSLTFADEKEGISYVARLEAMLDAGIVPPEFQQRADSPVTIQDAVRIYTHQVSVSDSDERILIVLSDRVGGVRLSQIDYAWAERFIKDARQVRRLSPSTIRHHVGALARMFDWLIRRGQLASNALRLLPKGYASYTPSDAAVLAATGGVVREDGQRDRRLDHEEEAAIRLIMAGEKQKGKERPLEMRERENLVLLFDLALETGMRLREMFTLSADQIDLSRSTIFLDKTKNGDKRQVPLSSVAIKLLSERKFDDGLVFPWWDGNTAMLRAVTSLLSRQFARIFDAAGCGDLHFHDLRHEACSRMYERTKLSDLEIAKIMGWRSLKMALRYANLRGSNLAGKLW